MRLAGNRARCINVSLMESLGTALVQKGLESNGRRLVPSKEAGMIFGLWLSKTEFFKNRSKSAL